jgi:hypothetical protein
MRKKHPKDYPEMVGRKPYAWGGWMLLLIVLGWLLFAWIGYGIIKLFEMLMS